MNSHLSLLYTTFPHEEKILEVSRQLLEKKLVACVNILGPIQSLYVWQGSLEKQQEVAVLLKTTKDKIPHAIKALEDLHPYETPSIMEIPLDRISNSFCKWVQNFVR